MMDFDTNLFESILTEGAEDVLGVDGYNATVYADLIKQEELIEKNADLYGAYFNINKILETKKVYYRIQTVSPAINVNTGLVSIPGITMEKDPADKKGIDEFVEAMKESLPEGLKLDYEIDEATEGKYKFNILITRK